MAIPAFVQASAGSVVTTGTSTVSLTGCTAGNVVFLVWVEDGSTNDSDTGAHVNTAKLDGTASDMDFFQNIPIGSPVTSRLHIFVGRVIANGTVSADMTVGASGADLFTVWYEFSECSSARSLAAPTGITENGSTDYYLFNTNTGTTISFATVTSTSSNELAVMFIGTDANTTLVSATGETGGDWTEPVGEFASASGTQATVGIQTASLASAGAISGGSITITSAGWGVCGFALKGPASGTFPPAALLDDFTRADGNIDADLTSVGSYTWASPMHLGDSNRRVLSNQCAPNNAAARYDNCIVNHDFSSNIRVSAVIVTAGTVVDDSFQLSFRLPYSSFPFNYGVGSTYYSMQCIVGSGGQAIMKMFQFIDGTPAFLTPTSGTETGYQDFAIGAEVAVECYDSGGATLINTYYKQAGGTWVSVASYSDSNASRATGQKVAIEGAGPSAGTPSAFVLDNLGVEAIAESVASVTTNTIFRLGGASAW